MRHGPFVANAAPAASFSTAFGLTTTAASGTYPFTVGMPFAEGAVPLGTNIQFDVAARHTILRQWSDGSLKHIRIDGHAALTQNVETNVTITAFSGVSGAGSILGPGNITAAAPQASIQCGAIGTVNFSSLYGSPFRVWVGNEEVIECIYRSVIGDPAYEMDAWFHVRLYVGGRIWIRAIVENGFLDNGAGAVSGNYIRTYVPTITIGGVVVYNNGGAALDHHAHTRYFAEGWIGGDPLVTPSHDPVYMIGTKLVPNYYKRSPSAGALNGLTQTYTPMGRGDLLAAFETGGFANHIGLLPRWDALYCTTGDARAFKSMRANTGHVNSYAIVWRDKTTHLIPKPSSFPTWTQSGPGQGGTDNYLAGSLNWERNHHPSEGYFDYICTGDYFALETMAMQASICWLWVMATMGSGTSRLLEPGQIRGNAWLERTIGQYAAIAPTGDAIAAEYRTTLSNTIDHWKSVADDPSSKQLGFVLAYTTSGAFPLSDAPWQQDFWIATLGHLLDIEPGFDPANLNALMQFMGKAVVGQYGPNGASTYCFTRGSAYHITIGPGTYPAFYPVAPSAFYATWGEVWTATFGSPNTSCGNTLIDGSPEFNSPGSLDSIGYNANAMPALAYAVDYGVAGADASWARLTGATNWNALINTGFDDTPNWGITPRNFV